MSITGGWVYVNKLKTISNSIKKLNKINSDLSAENRGFTKKEL